MPTFPSRKKEMGEGGIFTKRRVRNSSSKFPLILVAGQRLRFFSLGEECQRRLCYAACTVEPGTRVDNFFPFSHVSSRSTAPVRKTGTMPLRGALDDKCRLPAFPFLLPPPSFVVLVSHFPMRHPFSDMSRASAGPQRENCGFVGSLRRCFFCANLFHPASKLWSPIPTNRSSTVQLPPSHRSFPITFLLAKLPITLFSLRFSFPDLDVDDDIFPAFLSQLCSSFSLVPSSFRVSPVFFENLPSKFFSLLVRSHLFSEASPLRPISSSYLRLRFFGFNWQFSGAMLDEGVSSDVFFLSLPSLEILFFPSSFISPFLDAMKIPEALTFCWFFPGRSFFFTGLLFF